MDERRRPLGERRVPKEEFRKKILRFTGAVAIFGAMGIGVRLDEPPIDVRTVKVVGEPGEVQLLSTDFVAVPEVTPEGKLRFEPSSEEFFYPGREYQYVHRTNDIKSINDAWEQGAEVFDIDANEVDGMIYAEHGIVPQAEIFGMELPIPVVIDINEGEYKIGMPLNTYEQLVAHIAALSKESGRPLAVSTELKRGEFDAETLIAIIDIHRKYGVPVLMHSTDQEQLITVGSVVAQSYIVMLNR